MKGLALKSINDAVNACGDRAEQCARRNDHETAAEWQGIANELQRVFLRASDVLAREVSRA